MIREILSLIELAELNVLLLVVGRGGNVFLSNEERTQNDAT